MFNGDVLPVRDSFKSEREIIILNHFYIDFRDIQAKK